jgi:hypothetical protein
VELYLLEAKRRKQYEELDILEKRLGTCDYLLKHMRPGSERARVRDEQETLTKEIQELKNDIRLLNEDIKTRQRNRGKG